MPCASTHDQTLPVRERMKLSKSPNTKIIKMGAQLQGRCVSVQAVFEITAAPQNPNLDLARADSRNPRKSSSSATGAPITKAMKLAHGSLALSQTGWMTEARWIAS